MRFFLSSLLTVALLLTASPAIATVPMAEDHFEVVADPESSAPPRPRVRRTVTYQVASRGAVGSDFEGFRRRVHATLNDPRGWGLDGAQRFRRARRDPDVRIWLASPADVAAAHPTCDELFSCRVGPDVFINVVRWRRGATGRWDLPLSEYRRYVINHEVGHWLGLDHPECPRPGAPAPVMLQQTIGLDGCEANTWPLRGERRRIRQDLLK